MTHEEARKKWCPMTRVARIEAIRVPDQMISGFVHEDLVIVGGVNRDALGRSPDPIASCRCIATDCALWDDDSDRFGHGQCGLKARKIIMTLAE